MNKNRIVLITDGGIPKRFVWMMAIISGLAIANNYYSQPLLEIIKNELHISANTANQLTVSNQIGYALGLFFLIPLADKVSRRMLLKVNFSLLVVALFGMAFSPWFSLMICCNLIIGFCTVVPHIFIPIASQYSEPKKKSTNVGYILSGLLTGIIVSRVLSGFVGAIWGWREMFFLAAFMMIISAIVVLYYLPDSPPNFKGSYRELMSTLIHLWKRYPEARICAIRAGLGMGSLYAMWACLAFHIAGNPFSGGSEIVSLLSICAVFGVLTASNIGGLINRHGARRFGYFSCLVHLVAWVVFFLGGFTYTGMIIGIILIDMGQQCMQLSQQTTVLALETNATNRLNTIFMTSYFLFGSLGTFMAGIGWTILGWNGVVFVGTIFALFALLVTFYSHYYKKLSV